MTSEVMDNVFPLLNTAPGEMATVAGKGGQDMKKSTFARWFAVWLLVPVVLLWAGFSNRSAAAAEKVGKTAAADPRLDMVTALQATGPHPSLGDQAKVFGRLVGTWDGEYNEFSKDGKTARSSGEWIFGWVMEGRAIQDLFIIHPSARA